MDLDRGIAVNLVRSWLFQNLSFGGLQEATARVGVEALLCLLLVLFGLPGVLLLLGWILVHTLLWFFLYGGFSRIRVVFGISAPLSRLRAYVNRLRSTIGETDMFRIALLRGSVARSAMTPRSDVDILFVPKAGRSARLRGILFLWGLRLQSVFSRVPLQARWLDRDAFVSLNVVGESPVPLIPLPGPPDGRAQLAERGFLIAVSGRGPASRAPIAKGVADALHGRGLEVICVPGMPTVRATNTMTARLGRYHLGLRACLAQLGWRMQLNRVVAPHRTVIIDGYLPDLWASLEPAGPVPPPLRTLMVAIGPTPDVAFFLDSGDAGSEEDPSTPPQPSTSSERRGERWYAALLGMTFVTTGESPQESSDRILATLASRLAFA